MKKSTGKPTVGTTRGKTRVGVRKTQDVMVTPQQKLAKAMSMVGGK